MKAVVDTNVFISSFLSERGPPRKLIDAWKRGGFTWCLCSEILEEYCAVLVRFGMEGTREFAQLLEVFRSRRNMAWTVIDNNLAVIADDPADDKFLECAIQAGAEFVVSDDRHLKRLQAYGGVRIVSPAEFLKEHLDITV